MANIVELDNIKIGKGCQLIFISGPCVLENYSISYEIAKFLKKITKQLNIPFIFKASYDKANRTSINSYRGPGVKKGFEILKALKKELNISILSDIHRISEIEYVSEILDIIQIPAFLCRQTDLIIEAAKTGKIINIKKGQFLSPWDMKNVIEKANSVKNKKIIITERGTMFGYNNLVVDFRGIKIIQDTTGFPVIFDATHSVQLPGGAGTSSAGQREFAPILAKAAVASGADGIFAEVYKEPDKALCDGPNSLYLDSVPDILKDIISIPRN